MKIYLFNILWFLLLSDSCFALTTHCVDDVAKLTAALNATSTNGDDNIIQVKTGNYLAPPNGWQVTVDTSHDLTIRGGYTDSTCAQQSHNPEFTKLDGSNQWRPLLVNVPDNSSANIEISNLTFRDGAATIGAGLNIGMGNNYNPQAVQNYTGNILIENNQFINNTASQFAGGVSVYAQGGTLTFRTNLVAFNTAVTGGAAELARASISYITNNTVTNNTVLANGNFAFAEAGDAPHLTNNIFWNNGGTSGNDILIGSSNTILINNVVGRSMGSAPAQEINTLSVDPEFIGNDNFHLRPDSPLINFGTNTPAGGLSLYDLDGELRTEMGNVDLGAYELNDIIFANSFE